MTDYLHRVGRTGRVGMKDKCVAVSFMTRQRDVRMAWEIKVCGILQRFEETHVFFLLH